MVRESIWGQRNHSQKHNAHTSHAHGQCCITIDDCLLLNGCLVVMVRESLWGQRNHSQKHNAHTSNAHEEISQTY